MIPVPKKHSYTELLNAISYRVSKYSSHPFTAEQIASAAQLAPERIYPDFYLLKSENISGEMLFEIPGDATDVLCVVQMSDGRIEAVPNVSIVPHGATLKLFVTEPGGHVLFYQSMLKVTPDDVVSPALEPIILGACMILTEMRAYDRLHHDIAPTATNEQSTSEQESLMAAESASKAYQTYALSSAMPPAHTLIGIPIEACISRPVRKSMDEQTLQYLGVSKVPR